jgi:putative membrane protein
MHLTDALANERTFLAYLRTALAFIAFGFVIARFSLFEREMSLVAHVTLPGPHTSALFGAVMAISGVIIGLYGALRYVATDLALHGSEAKAMPRWAAIFGGLMVGAIGVVVAVDLFRFG